MLPPIILIISLLQKRFLIYRVPLFLQIFTYIPLIFSILRRMFRLFTDILVTILDNITVNTLTITKLLYYALLDYVYYD